MGTENKLDIIADSVHGQQLVVKMIPLMLLPTLGPVEVNVGEEHIFFTDSDGQHYVIETADIINFPLNGNLQ